MNSLYRPDLIKVSNTSAWPNLAAACRGVHLPYRITHDSCVNSINFLMCHLFFSLHAMTTYTYTHAHIHTYTYTFSFIHHNSGVTSHVHTHHHIYTQGCSWFNQSFYYCKVAIFSCNMQRSPFTLHKTTNSQIIHVQSNIMCTDIHQLSTYIA